MKTFQLAIIIVAFSMMILSIGLAEARISPMTVLQLYKDSDMILVGNVTSTEIDSSGIYTFYHVKVEQYLKSSQQNDTITVVGSGPNGGHPPPDPKFSVGDRVRLYLEKEDGMYMISMYSTKANPKCYAHELLGLGPFEAIPRGESGIDYSERNCGPPFQFTSYPHTAFLPPITQFKSGIVANDVKCVQGFQLVIKSEDGSPTCVKPQTAQKLVERGWGWAMQPIDSIKPLLPYGIIGLENDTGVVTLGNHTYYFETPNYTNTAYSNQVQISFHDVVFTLFPSGFRGGLPSGCGSDTTGELVVGGGRYYWVDAKFSDGIHELLHIFADSHPCPVYPTQTYFSNHTNPQAGLTFYDGKMKLLVRTNNQSSSALNLFMSIDSDIITPEKPIGITISVNNTLATPVDISAQNNWSYPNVSTGPCDTIGYGISLLDGFYDKNNVTQGKILNLFDPDTNCPFIQETAKVYEFQPSSGNVKQVQCKPIEGLQCETGSYQMGQNYKFNGYWDGGTVQPFKSGIYTIVGADEWGHVAIEHFVVTNSTIFAGNLGSMSCPVTVEPPLSLGGVEFSASIKNFTGFAHYYNSEQYGNVFYLHKGTSGNISVQYDAPANASWFQNNDNMPLNVTNGATFFYMANVTNGKMIMSYAVSLYNDETGHHSMICHYGMPFGGFAEPCNTDNKGDIPPSELHYASKLLHPEISTSFEPNSVMLYPNSNPVFTATISANSDAMPGTYWLSLERSLCGPGVLAKLVVLP